MKLSLQNDLPSQKPPFVQRFAEADIAEIATKVWKVRVAVIQTMRSEGPV